MLNNLSNESFELKLSLNLKEQDLNKEELKLLNKEKELLNKEKELLNKEQEILNKQTKLVNEEFKIRNSLLQQKVTVNQDSLIKKQNVILKDLSKLPIRDDHDFSGYNKSQLIDNELSSLSDAYCLKDENDDENEFNYSDYMGNIILTELKKEREVREKALAKREKERELHKIALAERKSHKNEYEIPSEKLVCNAKEDINQEQITQNNINVNQEDIVHVTKLDMNEK